MKEDGKFLLSLIIKIISVICNSILLILEVYINHSVPSLAPDPSLSLAIRQGITLSTDSAIPIGKTMNDDSYIVIKCMHDSLKVSWTSSLNDKSRLLFQFLVFISDCKQFM